MKKTVPKTVLFSITFFLSISDGFGQGLGTIWEGFGAVWGASRALLGASWPFWGRSKSSFFQAMVQAGLQEASGVDFGRFGEGFWQGFGRFGEGLGRLLGRLLAVVGGLESN